MLKVRLLNESAQMPTRANQTDAGLDLYASYDTFIPEGGTALVSTGIAVQFEPNYVAKIEDRSSMAVKGLRTGAGVIDYGYNGEIKVVLHNLNNSETSSGYDPLFRKGYKIKKGDKIAQLLLYKVWTDEPIEVKSLDESERGGKGFGTSGR